MKIDDVDEVKGLLIDIDILFSNLDDIKKDLEEKNKTERSGTRRLFA